MTVARSSTCELEKRHCAGAARHQELGTPRDRTPMQVGICVHHMVHAASMLPEGELADVVIDRTTEDLIANGRSFDGGPVEYPTIAATITARGYALDFLDRDVIPERGDVDWMEAEVLVALDLRFKRVDRDLCRRCGHSESAHRNDGVCMPDQSSCSCIEFRSVATWQQAVDLAVIYRDEIDDEEVLVIETTDYKGGNCSKAWFTGLQGMANAVTAVALCPEADIARRRIISYMPWGGRYENVLDLRQQEDLDKLEDYRRAIEVAVAGHRRRQGRTPDELAQPGAGCSAGFGGCPWLLKCKAVEVQWSALAHAWGTGGLAANRNLDTAAWASMYALAKAVQQEAAKRVRVALVDTDEVVTVDSRSVVGWRQFPKTKIAANAPALLAREWVEAMLKLEPGSVEAVAAAATIEALLLNALPKSGGSAVVKGLVKRLADVIGWEEAKGLEERCLEDDSGRKLMTWKRPTPEPTDGDLNNALKKSIDAEKPAKTSSAADRNRDHDQKTDALLNDALARSLKK